MPSYPVRVWDGSQWVEAAAQPTDLSNYATKASPTFTGNVVLPSTTTIGGGSTLGSWTGYTPNYSGVLTGATPTGAYIKIGRTVIFWAQLGLSNTATYSGNIWIGLPFTANSQYAFQATLYNPAVGFYPIWCYGSGNAAELFAVNAASTYGTLEYATSTKPSTLTGQTCRFYVSGSYEATS